MNMGIKLVAALYLLYAFAFFLSSRFVSHSTQITQKPWLNRLLLTIVTIHSVLFLSRVAVFSAAGLWNFQSGVFLLTLALAVLILMLPEAADVRLLKRSACWILAILSISAAVLPAPILETETAVDMWRIYILPLHVASAFLGYACFVLAGLLSMMFLLRSRNLKGKKLRESIPSDEERSENVRFLSLEALDRFHLLAVEFGLPLMSFALILGGLYANHKTGQFWYWDPVNVVSTVVCLLFLVLVLLRHTIGWRGSRVAWITLICCGLSLGTVVALSVLSKDAHQSNYSRPV